MRIRIGMWLLCIVIIVATLSLGFVSFNIINYKKPLTFNARTADQGFQIMRNGTWEKFYVKGVNIGAALPGKWFTQFPEDEKVYLDWFNKIGEMNANCIRVYTLMPSQFYSSLATYNKKHSAKSIWLLQEIWPEENPEWKDYLKKEYIEKYNTEIKYVIDAVHGNARINQRTGRAYGVYSKDVSKYILGYLVGRELEPEEIIATNDNNPGFSFKGEYLSSSKEASPSEAWLTMNCDYLLEYEENKYSNQHPVAIVSWPTLDVQEHDSEWNSSELKSLEYNDKVSIDINHIDMEAKLQAGFFGAYHIYPNYPDFMNNESSYDSYYDENGRLRYGGYLREFIKGHTKYPALVAEFGLATGMGNAHTSPDGLNHGGLTEVQQGEGVVRMMKAIQKEGYAGGLIFEWLDEWAKKTWTTEPFMIPYDRHAYWHNVIDPEQNYGILAMESVEPKDNEYEQQGSGVIKTIGLKKDASYLYINLEFQQKLDLEKDNLYIGIDTYDRIKGEYRFSPEIDTYATTGMEFLLNINGKETSRLLVQPGYNIAQNKFSSYKSEAGVFDEIKPLINNARVTKDGHTIPAIYEDGSKLTYGTFLNNAYHNWYMEGDTIYLRIPWGRLNFTDPSEMRVLEDNQTADSPLRDQLSTVKSEGILISALIYDRVKNNKIEYLSTEQPFTWTSWEEPQYAERLKESYDTIKEYFEMLK